MKKHFTLFLHVFAVLFLSACVTKEPIIKTYPISLSIKSNDIKIMGDGFYRAGEEYANLQLYSAGKLVLNYESNTLVCLNNNCMPKSTFNKKIFLNSHYGKIMDDILAYRPIYNSKNIEKNDNGFSQSIFEKNRYDISYQVENNIATFRDNLNNILIKIIKHKGNQ